MTAEGWTIIGAAIALVGAFTPVLLGIRRDLTGLTRDVADLRERMARLEGCSTASSAAADVCPAPPPDAVKSRTAVRRMDGIAITRRSLGLSLTIALTALTGAFQPGSAVGDGTLTWPPVRRSRGRPRETSVRAAP